MMAHINPLYTIAQILAVACILLLLAGLVLWCLKDRPEEEEFDPDFAEANIDAIEILKAIDAMNKLTGAEEVVPAKRGKWENQAPTFCWNKYGVYQTAYKCSVCGELTPIDYNICPWCGARMDGGT